MEHICSLIKIATGNRPTIRDVKDCGVDIMVRKQKRRFGVFSDYVSDIKSYVITSNIKKDNVIHSYLCTT